MCRSGPYGPLGIASSGWVDYVIIAFAVDVLVGGPYVGGPRVFAVERRRTLPTIGENFCGGQFGEDPLVSVFGAI
jgi:hypothetical protein